MRYGAIKNNEIPKSNTTGNLFCILAKLNYNNNYKTLKNILFSKFIKAFPLLPLNDLTPMQYISYGEVKVSISLTLLVPQILVSLFLSDTDDEEFPKIKVTSSEVLLIIKT